MSIDKVVRSSVVIIVVFALIILAILINQGDEYIEASAMSGNYGFVSVMVWFAIVVLFITILLTLIFSFKNLFSDSNKLKKAGLSLGSFLLVFIIAFLLSSGEETPLPNGEILSSFESKLVESGIRTFYLLTLAAVGIMSYFSVKKYFKK